MLLVLRLLPVLRLGRVLQLVHHLIALVMLPAVVRLLQVRRLGRVPYGELQLVHHLIAPLIAINNRRLFLAGRLLVINFVSRRMPPRRLHQHLTRHRLSSILVIFRKLGFRRLTRRLV